MFDDDAIFTTDLAWEKVRTGTEGTDWIKTVQGNGNTAYTVKVSEAGFELGSGSGAVVDHVLMVIAKDTANHVVTACPITASVP